MSTVTENPTEDWDAPPKAPAAQASGSPGESAEAETTDQAEQPPTTNDADAPTDKPPAEADEMEVTLRDIVRPARSGSVNLSQVARDLGLDRAMLNARRWESCSEVAGNKWVEAASVIAWIEKDNIPYRISAEARAAVLRRKQRAKEAAAPKPVTDKTPSLVGGAVAAAKDFAQQDTAEREQQQEQYLRIIYRHADPRKEDAADLACLMELLDIAPNQAREDVQFLKQVAELRKLHEGREEAAEAARAANAARDELRKRHEKEEHDVWKLQRKTQRDHSAASHAANKAVDLRARRPLLFDGVDESGFPKLREPANLES